MDITQLGSGDNTDSEKSPRSMGVDEPSTCEVSKINTVNEVNIENMEYTPQMIDENENKLKERIAQCKNIIDSLKYELNEEKSKLEKDSKTTENPLVDVARLGPSVHQAISTDSLKADITLSCNMYSACIDSKLNCDENLIEYEKQLQKYQNTLNMAHTEKKNAIRKQMLAKAYKLKLLEIENQCNVELLRVKQSLQCLEPLKIIANKWKSNPENEINTLDLIPRYPELNANLGIEVSCFKNLDTKMPTEGSEDCTKKLP